ncbi:helix-turn-helix transcriptional regulator [Aeromicrobium sp. YIM 150415]|uniref:ArsR/SmtB family transcription factor n=1 Tax=Aeromicrobium sp. YIM 150415 TaxID=2803912 RepID=UPI00196238BB|nr:helix-turn-helix domain-containing protein [Aeromicrobium sp. YIM 150415]MBM9463308.1 helix-turn-helix transcriptional regulator [Aeromicrobium sp. YIM 150415]
MRERRIEDVDTLKALAHPLRLEALGELRAHGPATASELARALGESSGSLSYHLRQLARYGFVTDDASRDSRERRWRAVHETTSLLSSLRDTDEGHAAMNVVAGVQRSHLLAQLEAAESDPTALFDQSDYRLRLDRAELDDLLRDLHEVVGRYADRGGEHEMALHLVAVRPTPR